MSKLDFSLADYLPTYRLVVWNVIKTLCLIASKLHALGSRPQKTVAKGTAADTQCT